MVRPDDILRVVNHESYPLPLKWNSRPYTIKPHGEGFVPAACAFNWFGDPRSGPKYQSIMDVDGTRFFVSDRATEVRRLRIKWGAGMIGNEDSFEEVAIPTIELWDLEGNRLITVLEDPFGKSVTPATSTQSDDAAMRELVASQQRQIEALRQHLGLNEETEQAAADESELPQDGAELRTADVKG